MKNLYIAIFFIILQIHGILTAPTSHAASSSSSSSSSTSPSAPTTTTTPSSGITVVSTCTTPGVVALTFDDGPFQYSTQLLDLLKTNNITATFFVNGKNYGCIYDFADELVRAKAEGHQIGSHTWSHANLSTLTADRITTEMTQLDTALGKILGVTPKYMRPPYGEGANKDVVQKVLTDNGFTKVVLWDIDSGDGSSSTVSASIAQYQNVSPPPSSHISLNHDPVQSTVQTLVAQEIQVLKSKGFTFTTVGACLGEPTEDFWYKTHGTPSPRDSTWVCA